MSDSMKSVAVGEDPERDMLDASKLDPGCRSARKGGVGPGWRRFKTGVGKFRRVRPYTGSTTPIQGNTLSESELPRYTKSRMGRKRLGLARPEAGNTALICACVCNDDALPGEMKSGTKRVSSGRARP